MITECVCFLRDVQFQLHKIHEAECGEMVGKELIHRRVVSLLTEIAREVYQTDVLDRLEQFKECEAKVKRSRLRRAFSKWKTVFT